MFSDLGVWSFLVLTWTTALVLSGATLLGVLLVQRLTSAWVRWSHRSGRVTSGLGLGVPETAAPVT